MAKSVSCTVYKLLYWAKVASLSLLFLTSLSTLPTPALAAERMAGLSDAQFHHLSANNISIQLDGRGNNNTTNAGTHSPAMQQAPAFLKHMILAHESQQPTPYAANKDRLTSCGFISTTIELDNRQDTREWLITTRNGCPGLSRFGVKAFWLAQQAVNTLNTRVLLAEHGQQRVLIPKQANASGYRPVALRIKNSSITVDTSRGRQSYKANCKKQWFMSGGRYVGAPEAIEIWAIEPVSNSKAWVDIRDAFQGSTIRLPTTCQRY